MTEDCRIEITSSPSLPKVSEGSMSIRSVPSGPLTLIIILKSGCEAGTYLVCRNLGCECKGRGEDVLRPLNAGGDRRSEWKKRSS